MHHATKTPILDPTISVQRPRATGHVRTLSLSSAWTGKSVPDTTRVGDDSRHRICPCRLRCRHRPQLIHPSPRGKLSNRWQRRHRCFFSRRRHDPSPGEGPIRAPSRWCVPCTLRTGNARRAARRRPLAPTLVDSESASAARGRALCDCRGKPKGASL